jgi:hypothetical protein
LIGAFSKSHSFAFAIDASMTAVCPHSIGRER